MGTYSVCVAKGDGIGPEVVHATKEVLRKLSSLYRAEVRLELVDVSIGWEAFNQSGNTLPPDAMVKLENSDCLILGPLEVGRYPQSDGPSPSGRIRKHFDLYANIRPAVSRGFNSCYPRGRVDLVIVRENTEGFYADRNMFEGSGEFKPSKDVALSVRVIKRENCRRIVNLAIDLTRGRSGRITAVHKGNILKMTDGLFLEEFRAATREDKSLQADEKLVDAMATDLVLNPEKYDVIVTTNMYGDILSDEAAAISGSLGIAPALNVGDKYAMAQAVHGSAPDIAGKGIANPLAEIMSLNMLLDWLSRRHGDDVLTRMSGTLRGAVERTLESDAGLLTPDLRGSGTTSSVANLVLNEIERGYTEVNALRGRVNGSAVF